MDKKPEQAILDSWEKNVMPWIKAIDEGQIESRILATNQAITDTILNLAPRKVLDIGCGEGWLVRALTAQGIDTLGIDAIAAFVEAAKKQGKGRYRALGYCELAYSTLAETFDVLVCNFSLFGNESVLSVLKSAAELLNDKGMLVIHTLHPVYALPEKQTEDGWRDGSWAGFSKDFCDPAPWYYRTLENWRRLFVEFGFQSLKEIEPTNPKTGTPASIIFVGRKIG